MNPLGLVLIGLGIVLIVIGYKGTQHEVLATLHPKAGSKKSGSSKK